MTALLALIFLSGTPAKPVQTPKIEILDFEKGMEIDGKTPKPVGIRVEVPKTAGFAKDLPDRKDFKKELRKSMETLKNSTP